MIGAKNVSSYLSLILKYCEKKKQWAQFVFWIKYSTAVVNRIIVELQVSYDNIFTGSN